MNLRLQITELKLSQNKVKAIQLTVNSVDTDISLAGVCFDDQNYKQINLIRVR